MFSNSQLILRGQRWLVSCPHGVNLLTNQLRPLKKVKQQQPKFFDNNRRSKIDMKFHLKFWRETDNFQTTIFWACVLCETQLFFLYWLLLISATHSNWAMTQDFDSLVYTVIQTKISCSKVIKVSLHHPNNSALNWLKKVPEFSLQYS